jgi:hypothetical protein
MRRAGGTDAAGSAEIAMVVPLGKAYYHGLGVVTRTADGFEISFVMTVRVDEALDRGPSFAEAVSGDGV